MFPDANDFFNPPVPQALKNEIIIPTLEVREEACISSEKETSEWD